MAAPKGRQGKRVEKVGGREVRKREGEIMREWLLLPVRAAASAGQR